MFGRLGSPGRLLLSLAVAVTPLAGRIHGGCHEGKSSAVAADAGVARVSSIERGLSYLRHNRFEVAGLPDLSALIVLDYLQRKYALPAELAFENSYHGPRYADQLRLWGRMVGDSGPGDDVSLVPLTNESGIEDVVLHALYCDRLPLPSDYEDLLGRLAERGGYGLTHASLALKLLRDNGCSLRSSPVLDMEKRLRAAMLGLLHLAPRDPRFEELDVRYEALAFLQDFLGERSVSEQQFAKLCAEQQADGGWRPEADRPSGLHPTVLAVWALLAHAHPDAPGIRFARR